VKTLELVGVGALVIWGITKLGSFLSNQISVGSIKLKVFGTTPAGTTVRLFIPVENKAQVAYPFEAFQGNLFYGNYNLGFVSVPGPVLIPAAGTTTIQTDVYVPFANMANNIVAMIVNGEWLNAIVVKGTLHAAGLKLPVSQTISLV
jgi:hypothetical protein